jgi:hypothetical protein
MDLRYTIKRVHKLDILHIDKDLKEYLCLFFKGIFLRGVMS